MVANPGLGSGEALVDAMAEQAGPALAPESRYANRVRRRRERRLERRKNSGAIIRRPDIPEALDELQRLMKRNYPEEYAAYEHYGEPR